MLYTEEDLKEAFFNGAIEIAINIDMSNTDAGIEAFKAWFRQYNSANAIKNDDIISLLDESNSILRSMYQIVERKGKDTNWKAFGNQLSKILKRQYKFMYPEQYKE